MPISHNAAVTAGAIFRAMGEPRAGMAATRGNVLIALRVSGRPMTSIEVAEALDAPARTVGRVLGVLFFKNLIERLPLPAGSRPRFLYRAVQVRA